MIRGSHALLSQVTDKTCFFLLNNIKYQFTSKLSIAIRIAFLCPFATWENLESGGCVIYMRDLRVVFSTNGDDYLLFISSGGKFSLD